MDLLNFEISIFTVVIWDYVYLQKYISSLSETCITYVFNLIINHVMQKTRQ